MARFRPTRIEDFFNDEQNPLTERGAWSEMQVLAQRSERAADEQL
jgi:hypothetical protein